jgi:hypothetical protein
MVFPWFSHPGHFSHPTGQRRAGHLSQRLKELGPQAAGDLRALHLGYFFMNNTGENGWFYDG